MARSPQEIIIRYSIVLILALVGCATTQDLFSARDAYQAGNLVVAHDFYVKHLAKYPTHVESIERLEEIRSALSKEIISNAAAQVTEGDGVTVPMYEAAIQTIEAAAKYDPEGKFLAPARNDYQNKIAVLRSELTKYSGRVSTALTARQFAKAKEHMDYIASRDPASPLINELNMRYTDAYAGHLEGKINELLSHDEVNEARAVLAELKTAGASADRLSRVTDMFQAKEIEWLRRTVKEDIKDKRFYRAYLNIVKSGKEKQLSEDLKTVREKGSEFYLTQAKKRFDKGQVSRAYLEAIKGFELDEQLSGMFEMHRDARDEVLKGVQKYIAISAFGAPEKNPDLGPQFSDALISYLFRILPYGINIVEREKIDLLMEEQKRELKEVGGLLNVDMIVTGNVSLMNIDQHKTESKATIRARVGQKMEINPEYEAMIRLYGEQAHARRDLPPRLVAVPEFENFQYNKGRATVKGFASVSARIFDTKKGSITYAQEFNANVDHEDEFQDGVEVAGVQGDPLELPTDTEIAEKLRAKIITQLAEVIQQQFAKRERTYLEEANYFISRKEIDKAMDPMAQGFLYCVKAKVDPADPDYSAIRDLIVEYTESDFLW